MRIKYKYFFYTIFSLIIESMVFSVPFWLLASIIQNEEIRLIIQIAFTVAFIVYLLISNLFIRSLSSVIIGYRLYCDRGFKSLRIMVSNLILYTFYLISLFVLLKDEKTLIDHLLSFLIVVEIFTIFIPGIKNRLSFHFLKIYYTNSKLGTTKKPRSNSVNDSSLIKK